MNRSILISTALLATAALAACSKEDAPAPAPTNEAAAPMPMAANAPATETATAAKTGKGSATVTAVDAAAGTITLDHGPIPEVGWPAMKMTFNAAPDLVQSVKVGDKVSFDLQLSASGATVTAIRRE